MKIIFMIFLLFAKTEDHFDQLERFFINNQYSNLKQLFEKHFNKISSTSVKTGTIIYVKRDEKLKKSEIIKTLYFQEQLSKLLTHYIAHNDQKGILLFTPYNLSLLKEYYSIDFNYDPIRDKGDLNILTPIEMAIFKGNFEQILFLQSRGIRIERDTYSLGLNSNRELIAFLIDQGANPYYGVINGILLKDKKLVSWITDQYQLDLNEYSGIPFPVIYYAIYIKDFDMVKFLIKKYNVVLNRDDPIEKRTIIQVLFYKLIERNKKIINLDSILIKNLVKSGYKITIRDILETLINKHDNEFKIFLKNFDSSNINKLIENNSLLDIVINMGKNKEIINLLRKYGAKRGCELLNKKCEK